MPVAAQTKLRRGTNPVKNVATGGIAQRINGAIATERVRTTGSPVVLPREPLQNDIVPTDGLPSLKKQAIRVSTPSHRVPPRPQQQASPRRQTVLFAVQKKTRYGQAVRLVGDSNELGGWSMDHAIELLWGEGHEWHAHVQLPPGDHTFKFVLVDDAGEVEWEASPNRQIEICPMTASTQYCTRWNSTKAETTSAPLHNRTPLEQRAVALSASSSSPSPSSPASRRPPSRPTPLSTPTTPSASPAPATSGSGSGPAGPSGRSQPASPFRSAAALSSPSAWGAPPATPPKSSPKPSPAPSNPPPPAPRGADKAAASTSGRPAAPPAAARKLDLFAVCGIKGKLWKVDLGGMDDVFGIFSPPSSPPATPPSTTASKPAAPKAPPAAKPKGGRRSNSSLSASTSSTSSTGTRPAPRSRPVATTLPPSQQQARTQARPMTTQAAAAVAAPPAPLPTQQRTTPTPTPTPTPTKPATATQQVADARQKLKSLLGSSTPAAAAAAAAVANRRAVAAENASMMSALAVPAAASARHHVARKLRPEERAELMRKAQWCSDDGGLPLGAKPVVLEVTVQQRMSMLFTGLITGDLTSMPLW